MWYFPDSLVYFIFSNPFSQSSGKITFNIQAKKIEKQKTPRVCQGSFLKGKYMFTLQGNWIRAAPRLS